MRACACSRVRRRLAEKARCVRASARPARGRPPHERCRRLHWRFPRCEALLPETIDGRSRLVVPRATRFRRRARRGSLAVLYETSSTSGFWKSDGYEATRTSHLLLAAVDRPFDPRTPPTASSATPMERRKTLA